ncbi:PREDICTED: pickpocket protein 19-like [Rhagoletis zephyria]|uniref:pickpocket protein 19-like n=1 Tax=Rhagoletis zephyria TaxID=28612 RepID=UPI0008117E43|nr:PREDICTED: pickpocket protein 19-like [Rhagoletis zephyria]
MLTEELVPNRRLTRIYPRANLITFEKYQQQQQQQQLQHKATAKEARKASKGFRIVKELIGELGQQTSIPGLSKPLALNMGAVERLFWTIGFLCALGMMIYVIQMLAARYNRQQFKTIVNATNYPIYRIVFPEVYLCNQNRLNWARFNSAKENYLRREHHNTELERLFTEVVALYDTFYFGSFDRFEKLNTTRPLHELDYVNFTLVAQFMAWRCDELLTDCVWRHRPMNCCDIFSARRSIYGFCMSFNTIETAQGQLRQKLDDKWPWRATRNGPGNGLNVRVLINEQMHSPFASREKGIMFMLMEPGVWWSYPNQVHVNDQIRVKLDAQLSFYDETTRRLSSQVRECVFDDERNSLDFKTLMNHKYMFENCQAECLQEHTMKYCNCSLDIFFPPSQYPACKLSDMPCLAQHNNHLKYFEQSGEKDSMPINVSAMGMVCECFLNCLSLAYLIDVRTNDLPTISQQENNSHMDMDFFFIRDSIVVFRTTDFAAIAMTTASGNDLPLASRVVAAVADADAAAIEAAIFTVDCNMNEVDFIGQRLHHHHGHCHCHCHRQCRATTSRFHAVAVR